MGDESEWGCHTGTLAHYGLGREVWGFGCPAGQSLNFEESLLKTALFPHGGRAHSEILGPSTDPLIPEPPRLSFVALKVSWA